MNKYVYSQANQVVVCGDFARAGRSYNLVGWGGKASGISVLKLFCCGISRYDVSRNTSLTLAVELSKEMLVLLLSLYENSSKWILRLAEQRNGEYFAQLEVRLHPWNHKSRK